MLKSWAFWQLLLLSVCFYIVLRSLAVDAGAWYEHYAAGVVGIAFGRACLKYL